jgi:pimeloyl-ACP methyl ester carboxylesterase
MFVRNFLDALEIDRAVLIGASLGAHVAAQVAIDHTARVSRLILVGPAGLSPWAFADRQQTWSSYRDANRAVIGRSIAARRGREPSWEEVEETYRMVAAPSHQEAIDSLSDYMLQGEWERDFVTDALAGVTSRVPTYILWGQDDRTFPYADGLAAHARLPGTTMATFENSGHDVDLDYPRLFHELLGRILDDDLASWQQAGVSIHTSAAPA